MFHKNISITLQNKGKQVCFREIIDMKSFSDSQRLAFAREIWRSFNRGWGAIESKFAFGSDGMDRFAAPSRRQPKESTFDKLKKLKDDPNIYISYVGTVQDTQRGLKKDKEPNKYPRVGVNPKSHYNTPLGVYTYPLHEIWDRIEANGNLTDVPYQGDKPYIAIIRVREDRKFIDDMYNDYDSADFDDDKRNLRSYFVPDVLKNEEFEKIADKAMKGASEKNPVVSMWNLVRHLSYLVVQMKAEGADRDEIVNQIIRAYDLNDIMPDKESGKLNPYGLSFNRILNGVLEYDGFADKSGKGYIHSSEPTQAVFLDPRSYDVLEIADNENSGSSDVANRKYKAKQKLGNFVNAKKDQMSDEQWKDVLTHYPEFWNQAPEKPEVFKDPQVVEMGERYWSKEFSVNNITYATLPEHLEFLPQTRDKIKESWFGHLAGDPTASNSVPDFMKSDPNFDNKLKDAWTIYLPRNPGYWNTCPYDDVKADPELQEAIINWHFNQIEYNPVSYDNVPEEFKDNEKIVKAATDGVLGAIASNPESWSQFNDKFKNNETVLIALRDSWKAALIQRPSRMNELPEHLQKDEELWGIAKQKTLELISENLAPNIYGRYSDSIPEILMKKDKEVRNKVVDSWLAYITREGAEPQNIVSAPQNIQKVARFRNTAKKIWKEHIKEHPPST